MGFCERSKSSRFLSKELGLKDEEALLAALGYGRITARHVLSKLVPPEKLESGHKQPESSLERLFRLASGKIKLLGIRVKGIDDVWFGLLCAAIRYPANRSSGLSPAEGALPFIRSAVRRFSKAIPIARSR